MFLLIYNMKATNLSILFEVRETSLPFFILVTFDAKTYTNGFPFTSL